MWNVFHKHIGLLLVWGVIFSMVVAGLSFLLPLKYSATSQVLIISRDRTGVDPYTQAKSAERIGGNLAEVMKTSDFLNKVLLQTDAAFDKDFWTKLDDRTQRLEWQRNVETEVVYNTSLLKITTYASSKDEAVRLSGAVATTIVSHGWEYVGGDILLKQVDNPLPSRLPARPNFILNGLAGFIIGVLVAGLWIVRYKRHIIFG